MASTPPRDRLAIRHSIAPRVLDNSMPMRTLASHERFSVRVEPRRASSAPRNAPILSTFVWRDSGARVQIAGSFDDWRKHDMTYVPGVGYHVLVVELPPGEYFYRFVVDGRWKVSEDDENLREDNFGEWSHFLQISDAALEGTKSCRFSTAALARVDLPRDRVGPGEGSPGDSSESEIDEWEEEDTGYGGFGQVEPERLPRNTGEEYIGDYGDDEFGELDLQADIYEAMYDCKEEVSEEQSRKLTLEPAGVEKGRRDEARRRQKQPTKKLFRNVFARLFGRPEGSTEDDDGFDSGDSAYKNIGLASPDLLRQVDSGKKSKGGRLRVWFAGDRKKGKNKQRVEAHIPPAEEESGAAMRFNQAEENANSRQELGKALFAQERYDAALAMFSLSVKIREDNGLRNAKSTAVAHTDVASAFIHLNDLKNAQKHLDIVLGIYQKKTFSGGKRELADCHCFIAVVAEMRGDAKDAESSYRKAISLYEQGSATRNNLNYETACENLKDNLRRQTEGPAAPMPDQGVNAEQQKPQNKGSIQQYTRKLDSDGGSSPVSARDSAGSFEKENATPAVYNPTPRSKIKSILRNTSDVKPINVGPTPQTIESINSFPDTMESACTSQQRQPSGPNTSNSKMLDPSALATTAGRPTADNANLPPSLDKFRRQASGAIVPEDGGAAGQRSSLRKSNRRSSGRPTTWKALADVARASMPVIPTDDSDVGHEEDEENLGTYEEMSRGWHRDGRELLLQNKFTEAIDMYTLAIYTRKRHGPWNSRANAETHVEYARALFATKDVAAAASTLRDSILILEKLQNKKHDLLLGQVWGNLGSALDRLGGRAREAEMAHSTGLVAFVRAGVSKDDEKWTKAWRSLCVNNKAQGSSAKPLEQVWQIIDEQIRGVVPMTSAASLKI